MLSQAELDERRKGLGASDFAALLGLNPFATAIDVWLSKVHGKDTPPNWPMLLGSLLEPHILDDAEKRFGKLARKERVVHPSTPLVVASLDARIEAVNEPLDAKTSGLTGFGDLDAWGEDGSDVVPYSGAVQIGIQASCLKRAEHGHIAARLGPRGDERYYSLTVKHSIIDDVILFGLDWWKRYVVGREMPEVTAPIDAKLLKGIQREVGKCIPLPEKLIQNFVAARDARAKAKEQWDPVEARYDASRDAIKLALALERAESGQCGPFTFTMNNVHIKAQNQERMNVKETK